MRRAGVGRSIPTLLTPPRVALEDIDEAGWRRSIDTNLTATFFTLKCFLAGTKARRRGTIVTISSAAARRPTPFSPISYAVAKAGIQLLTQDVAAQAGPFGARVNCIAPETIVTEGTHALMSDAVRDQLIAGLSLPSRRLPRTSYSKITSQREAAPRASRLPYCHNTVAQLAGRR